MQNKVNSEQFISELQMFLQEKIGDELPNEKVKGFAFEILKQCGALTPQDQYKSYDHITRALKLFNENLNDIFDWEDIEHFTGNLFYAMRLATKRPMDEIDSLVVSYERKYKNSKVESEREFYSQFSTDMFLLKTSLRKNISRTWEYIEKTQITGAGMIVSKILKFLLDNKNVERSESK